MTLPQQSVRTCFQCGRKGTRGFKLVPETTVELKGGPPFTVGGWYVCAAEKACRGRWPKPSFHDLEAMFA